MNISSKYYFLYRLCLLIFLALSGCVDKQSNNKNSDIENKLSQMESAVSELKTQITSIEKRLQVLEEQINNNLKEKYLRVNTQRLNIRSGPSTSNNEFAVAQEGAYLRYITTNKNWYKVEFLINGIPHQGYVSPKNLEEQFLDPISFNGVFRRGMIQILWEDEVIKTVVKEGYQIVGIYIKATHQQYAKILYSNIANRMLNNKDKIYTKNLTEFSAQKVPETCTVNEINAILSLELDGDNLFVQLYGMKGHTLYITPTPITLAPVQPN